MNDVTRMTTEEIADLAFRALVASGASSQNARSVAASTAAAERDGISSHGLLYVPIYCEHVQCGKVDGNASQLVERPRPATIVVDAMTGFAHPAIDKGFGELVPAAKENGVAVLAIRNSYNCGVLGYHTERLADQGLVALGFTNSPASIAPIGGNRPVIGTNPFSLAVPGEHGVEILIDQSASVIAKSEVMKRAREGEDIPHGWALGPDGESTTDPAIALKGSMAPAGGQKGVGSGLMVEIFAAMLSGATLGIDAAPFSGTQGGPPKTGQFFIAVDPSATSGGNFSDQLARLASAITDQPDARLPGARRHANRTENDRTGISVKPDLVQRIEGIAAG